MQSNLDSRKAEAAIGAFVDRNKGAAGDWLLQMGYAISGNTGWLNQRKSKGHINVYPSVRREGDGVRLTVNWRTAGRRVRRQTAKSLRVAQRKTWTAWTNNPRLPATAPAQVVDSSKYWTSSSGMRFKRVV